MSVVGTGFLCLMGRKQLFRVIQTEKINEKQQLSLNTHVSICTCTFSYGTTLGPADGSARQIHGPAHVVV